MPKPVISQNSNSVEFLIAEYNQISEETRRLRNEGLNRLNFFITVTSSILGGLVLLTQINATSSFILQWISLAALIFLTLIGWNTFRFTISRDINTDLNLRAMGRIRRFFIDHDPPLDAYLTWPATDEPTGWVTRNTSNLRGTTQSILALLLALSAGLIAYLIGGNLFWAGPVGLIGFIISLTSLILYARKRFAVAAKLAQATVRFPKTEGNVE